MFLLRSVRSSFTAHLRNSSSALALPEAPPRVVERATVGFLRMEGTTVELVERTAAGAGLAGPPGAFTLPLAPTVVQGLAPVAKAAAGRTGVCLLARSA